MFIRSLAFISTLLSLAQAAPLVPPFASAVGSSSLLKARSAGSVRRQNSFAGPVIGSDFPDPAIISFGGGYDVFSTNSGGIHMPLARAEADNRWALDGTDSLPAVGSWAIETDIWAPDVAELDDGTFVMYYSAPPKNNSGFHCVGTATSKTVGGPYQASDQPFACPTAQGGALDPNGYKDPATSLRYVVYKVDGNHNGNGGDCHNSIEPIVPTPIQLQQVSPNGISPIGEPVTILDRDDSDGPLVEAPSLYRSLEGIYFLFYSSGCFTGSKYNVRYATAIEITGPYIKAPAPLIVSGDGPILNGPGGADISPDGQILVFHANLNPPGKPLRRALFAVSPTFNGKTVII